MKVNKHGILPEIEMRLSSLGISNPNMRSSNQAVTNNLFGKRVNPRETFTRGESRKKPFDLDYAEEENSESGKLIKSHKMAESQPKMTSGDKITKKVGSSAARMVMSIKTRQSMRPYQSRELRIKSKPGRVMKGPRRGISNFLIS